MKKTILVLLILLFGSQCLAATVQNSVKQVIARKNATTVNTDSCTGTLLFSWHAENTDVTLGGIAGGVNNGCSVGDSTATLGSGAEISTSQYSDGIKSLSYPTASDLAAFTVTSNDIISSTAGTIVMKIRVSTWSEEYFIRYYVDATNNLGINLSGADEIRFAYQGNGDYVTATTTDANMAVDTWYTITAKWAGTDVNPNASIVVCDVNNANCSTTITSNTNLTAFTSTSGTLWLGNSEGGSLVGYVDNIKIYNSTTP